MTLADPGDATFVLARIAQVGQRLPQRMLSQVLLVSASRFPYASVKNCSAIAGIPPLKVLPWSDASLEAAASISSVVLGQPDAAPGVIVERYFVYLYSQFEQGQKLHLLDRSTLCWNVD